jgi:hypothetical protein
MIWNRWLACELPVVGETTWRIENATYAVGNDSDVLNSHAVDLDRERHGYTELGFLIVKSLAVLECDAGRGWANMRSSDR